MSVSVLKSVLFVAFALTAISSQAEQRYRTYYMPYFLLGQSDDGIDNTVRLSLLDVSTEQLRSNAGIFRFWSVQGQPLPLSFATNGEQERSTGLRVDLGKNDAQAVSLDADNEIAVGWMSVDLVETREEGQAEFVAQAIASAEFGGQRNFNATFQHAESYWVGTIERGQTMLVLNPSDTKLEIVLRYTDRNWVDHRPAVKQQLRCHFGTMTLNPGSSRSVRLEEIFPEAATGGKIELSASEEFLVAGFQEMSRTGRSFKPAKSVSFISPK